MKTYVVVKPDTVAFVRHGAAHVHPNKGEEVRLDETEAAQLGDAVKLISVDEPTPKRRPPERAPEFDPDKAKAGG